MHYKPIEQYGVIGDLHTPPRAIIRIRQDFVVASCRFDPRPQEVDCGQWLLLRFIQLSPKMFQPYACMLRPPICAFGFAILRLSIAPAIRKPKFFIIAKFVLSKNIGAVLLLTACIEYFTQLHYTSAFKDNESLDPLTKQIFKSHWLEESQHARMDHLETLRAFGKMTDAGKDEAINDLIGLVGAVDGLIQKQSGLDVQNLSRYTKRTFTDAESTEIYNNVLRAKRYTFIESGVTHPNFLDIFVAVTTPQQQEKVTKSLNSLLQAPASN